MATTRSVRWTLTTNATPTEIFAYPISIGPPMAVELTVIARDMVDGTAAMWAKRALVKNLTGTGVLVGALIDLFTAQKDTNAAAWTLAGSIASGAILVTATGAARRNIQWSVSANILEPFIAGGTYGAQL